jgi:hypothetical protein
MRGDGAEPQNLLDRQICGLGQRRNSGPGSAASPASRAAVPTMAFDVDAGGGWRDDPWRSWQRRSRGGTSGATGPSRMQRKQHVTNPQNRNNMSCHKVDMSLLSRTTLQRSVGCALLGASLIACGVDTRSPEPARIRKVPLSVIAASPETNAETGVATWELFRARRTAPNAKRAYALVARDAHAHVIHSMRVQMIEETAGQSSQVSTSSSRHMLIDQQGSVLENTLTLPDVQLHQKFGHDANLSSTPQEYGCYGDIAWSIGGLVGAIGTCGLAFAALPPFSVFAVLACVGAVVAGPIAGVISVVEDCDLPQGHVEVGALIEVTDPTDWEEEEWEDWSY